MSKKIEFNACKFLDFSDDYMATKAGIALDETKVCWERRDADNVLQLCQFCQKRGRLNSPTACLSEKEGCCSKYESHRHIVTIDD